MKQFSKLFALGAVLVMTTAFASAITFGSDSTNTTYAGYLGLGTYPSPGDFTISSLLDARQDIAAEAVPKDEHFGRINAVGLADQIDSGDGVIDVFFFDGERLDIKRGFGLISVLIEAN